MSIRRCVALGLPFFSVSAMATVYGCAGDSSQVGTPLVQDASSGTNIDATTTPSDSGASFAPGSWMDSGLAALPPRVAVASELISKQVNVADLMFAAGELQTSGEPFASNFAGRNLNDYNRDYLPPDEYILNLGLSNPEPIKDLFGFSTAVESYEYSKYHMNMVANETTAGLSLAVGPVIAARPEATPLLQMQGRANELLTAAGTDVGGYATLPPPVGNAANYLGFPGLWPEFAPFESFDPSMYPSTAALKSCTAVTTGYGGLPTGGATTPEFECNYNSLHLINRDAQVVKTLVPAALGFATWKEALWSIDFAGRLHDSASNPVTAVDDAGMALVGTRNNQVQATSPPGAAVGTYLGSTPLEDMWGLMMLEEMDNQAEFLVDSMSTSDGVTLGGFTSKAVALAYDYTTPLRWFPAAVAVTETAMTATAPFPSLASMTITDPTSRSVDLAALIQGHSIFFSTTDARNAAVGQQIGLQCTFDGDPFPSDDGLADGEETAHDRSLSVLRVAFVDLDRLHSVPLVSGEVVTVDTTTVTNGLPIPGNTITTTTLAHTTQALRLLLLSLNAAVSEYGAADPSPAADLIGILNTPAIHPPAPGAETTMSPRVRQLFMNDLDTFMNVLTASDGSVVNGATVVGGVVTPVPGTTLIESQASAIRAMSDAFLMTQDTQYLVRGQAIARKLLTAFYSPSAMMYGETEENPNDIIMTPTTYAWLQSGLRQTHEVLHDETDPLLNRNYLEGRVARLNKLYLNGWDDLNGDQNVDTATECLAARMQQGEQLLTGELGTGPSGGVTIDRDSDCVYEIDYVQTGSVLASQVHFFSPPQ